MSDLIDSMFDDTFFEDKRRMFDNPLKSFDIGYNDGLDEVIFTDSF